MKPAAAESIVAAVEEALSTTHDAGHVLVFLPGAEEIRRAARQLESIAIRYNSLIFPLHGSLPGEEQDRALRPSERRKIILATNVAETSLTIDGVTTVIDSGLARFASDDPARGLDRLELGKISRASAGQRAGQRRSHRDGALRAVVVGAGAARDECDRPARSRAVDLAATVLTLHAWGRVPSRAVRLVRSAAVGTSRRGGTVARNARRLDGEKAHAARPAIIRGSRASEDCEVVAGRRRSGVMRRGAALAAILSEPDFARFDRDRRGRIVRFTRTS